MKKSSSVDKVLCYMTRPGRVAWDAIRDAVDAADGRDAYLIFNGRAYHIHTFGTKSDLVKEIEDRLTENQGRT